MNERQTKILELTKLRYSMIPKLMGRLSDNDDLVGYILKCHLFTELLLDEIIKLVFSENGSAILELGLTYHQKLQLTSKLEIVDDFKVFLSDEVVLSLRKLNKLRNGISHEIDRAITDADILDLFVGLEVELPYNNILEHGQKSAIKRYTSFIFGLMLPKSELGDYAQKGITNGSDQ